MIKQKQKNLTQLGFTIVELLIVVVVIAILAAITIVSYNGITVRAKEAAVKGDLSGNAKLFENQKTINGSYPQILAPNSLRLSSNNTGAYVASPQNYCLTISNGSAEYNISSRNGSTIEQGKCSGVAWAAKGNPNPSVSGTHFTVLKTKGFTPGTYRMRCVTDGYAGYYANYTIASSDTSLSPNQMSCYAGPGHTIAIEIENWGVSESTSW